MTTRWYGCSPLAGSWGIEVSGGLFGHSGLYTGTSPNNSVRSPCAEIQTRKENRRCTPTFGKESYIFHVTIRTFRNFGGRDSLLWGDVAESLRKAGAGVLCAEGKKACNRRANTPAGYSGSKLIQSL